MTDAWTYAVPARSYRTPTRRNKDAAVHPTIRSDLAQAHIADLRRRAQLDSLARAARPERRQGMSRRVAVGRRAVAVLCAHRTGLGPRRRYELLPRICRLLPILSSLLEERHDYLA